MTARPYRVLVVEDEQLTAETYVAHLDRLPGFEVAAVAGSLLARGRSPRRACTRTGASRSTSCCWT